MRCVCEGGGGMKVDRPACVRSGAHVCMCVCVCMCGCIKGCSVKQSHERNAQALSRKLFPLNSQAHSSQPLL